MSETKTIRYNLKERGRKHVGQERNFNIKAICDAINSPSCQERVATRGMAGYYGHLPRIRFGMSPVEGVLDGGKYIPVEPAFVTTYLKADYGGNVEHRAEFLDTASGRLAQKLFDSQMGGFSSAIDTGKPEFFGLDYVLEPNFLQNSYRGIALDDASGMSYDAVFSAEQNEREASLIALLDGVALERDAVASAMERLRLENEQMLFLLAQKGIEPAFDAVSVRAVSVASEPAERMRRDAREFRSARLPECVAPAPHPESHPLYERLLRQFAR